MIDWRPNLLNISHKLYMDLLANPTDGGASRMSDLDCPICGQRLDPQAVKRVGLDAISAEMLHEKAHSGKLVSLVQLGTIAENYLKPERFKAEAEILKVVERLMDK